MNLPVFDRFGSKSTLFALGSVIVEVGKKKVGSLVEVKTTSLQESFLIRVMMTGTVFLFKCNALILLIVGMTLIMLGTKSLVFQGRYMFLLVEQPRGLINCAPVLLHLTMTDERLF